MDTPAASRHETMSVAVVHVVELLAEIDAALSTSMDQDIVSVLEFLRVHLLSRLDELDPAT